MTKNPVLPKFYELHKPTLQALETLGGSGSNEEIEDTVIAAIKATSAMLEITHPKSGAPVLLNRIAWSRSWLKAAGLTANPRRGVWILTEEGRKWANKAPNELKKFVAEASRKSSAEKKETDSYQENQSDLEPEGEEILWSDLLLKKIQSIEPAAFERLCQRLLRESGFTRVEVTGKSGDGGIDGAGVLRVNLISFQVLFQCKRWKGSVPTDVVRNFRGAMQGRADKGLIITTGVFTADARREATRDGAPAIDLIDGKALCELLKERRLGVQVREIKVEEVVLDEEFFQEI